MLNEVLGRGLWGRDPPAAPGTARDAGTAGRDVPDTFQNPGNLGLGFVVGWDAGAPRLKFFQGNRDLAQRAPLHQRPKPPARHI